MLTVIRTDNKILTANALEEVRIGIILVVSETFVASVVVVTSGNESFFAFEL